MQQVNGDGNEHSKISLFIINRDSKLTRLLKDSIGNMSCRTTVLCHVSPDEERYSETLGTLQMISKISRSRRKKNKVLGTLLSVFVY